MKNKLARAIGIIEGCLHIKQMQNFDKAGLVRNLEEVKSILETLDTPPKEKMFDKCLNCRKDLEISGFPYLWTGQKYCGEHCAEPSKMVESIQLIRDKYQMGLLTRDQVMQQRQEVFTVFDNYKNKKADKEIKRALELTRLLEEYKKGELTWIEVAQQMAKFNENL